MHCTSFDYTAANNPRAKLKMDMQLLRNFSHIFDPPNCLLNSVKELDDSRSFVIYPNPILSELKISLNQTSNSVISISVLDILGKELLLKEHSGLDDVVINVSELSQGVYFVKVESGGKYSVKKFIKE